MSETRDIYTNGQSAAPRAVIHKKILDAAAENPGATMKELSDEITGATVDLVEKVLKEYGDPGEEVESQESETASEFEEQSDQRDTMIETNGHHDQPKCQEEELTEKQRETVWAIREYPEATQAELADILGVSPATINTRLNSIQGFDWKQRHEFVDEILDDDSEPVPLPNQIEAVEVESRRETTETDGVSAESAEVVELVQRLDALEERFEQLEPGAESDGECPIGDDPDLSHIVLRACLSSDRITEEEERAVVKALVD